MITFNAELIVDKVEKKDLPTRSGTNFRFVEATCHTVEEKPTYLVARVIDKMDVFQGEHSLFKVAVTSYKGKNEKVWNNFVLMAKKTIEQPKPVEPLETSLMNDFDDMPL